MKQNSHSLGDGVASHPNHLQTALFPSSVLVPLTNWLRLRALLHAAALCQEVQKQKRCLQRAQNALSAFMQSVTTKCGSKWMYILVTPQLLTTPAGSHFWLAAPAPSSFVTAGESQARTPHHPQAPPALPAPGHGSWHGPALEVTML